ncbi:hypothetical protein [Streptomyces sp. NPDC060184]|uniref:hypothetical protein n=1 Tax=Streptomyces sp. NPDC060184 TaxID=3347064 RepID=UPI00365DEBD6
MTHETGGSSPHPPMPAQPPRPAPQESPGPAPQEPPRAAPPEPPRPDHAPPKWSWWVVGILVPVLGLIVTLIVQTGNSTSRDPLAPPSAASRDSAESATPAGSGTSETTDPDGTPADDDTLTSPSPSPSEASPSEPSPSEPSTKILRTGDFTLAEGNSADLEHGTVGASVESPDMAWSGGGSFSVLNGRVAEPSQGATPRVCADMLLTFPHVTAEMNYGLEGTWYCMPTSANHLAAVAWLGRGHDGMRFHYIVWDTPAPSDDE